MERNPDGGFAIVGIAASASGKRGGTVIVQDEAASRFLGRPRAAINTGMVDFLPRLEEIPTAQRTLAAGSAD